MRRGLRALSMLPASLLAMAQPTYAASKPEVGAPAPAFELTLVDGGKISLADLKGQVVLLNFWATWCVPCRKEMPALDKLQETLGKPSETLERCLDLGGTGVDGRIFGL